MEWRERLRLDSEACLAELIAADADFSLDEDQPSYRGGTHYVTFGRYRGEPAAFKVFVAARRWENEAACLAHFGPSGLVPKVFYRRPGSLIVMERLPGLDVLNALSDGTRSPREVRTLSREVGAAFGRLATLDPPKPTADYTPLTDFPDWGWNRGLSSIVDRCLREGRRIVSIAGPRYAETLASSLARIEERRSAVASEPLVLFHEDVGNLRVEGARFVGFYDLELCRGGTRSTQLGACLNLCGDGRLDWGWFVEGFEKSADVRLTKTDHKSILATNHLLRWMRILLPCVGSDVSLDEEGLASALTEAEACADEMIAAEQTIGPRL